MDAGVAAFVHYDTEGRVRVKGPYTESDTGSAATVRDPFDGGRAGFGSEVPGSEFPGRVGGRVRFVRDRGHLGARMGRDGGWDGYPHESGIGRRGQTIIISPS